jgi:two-component system LytT family sensor kinase
MKTFCNIVFMRIFGGKSISKWPLHLLFWIGVWFLYFYFFSYNTEDKPYIIWFTSLLVPVTIAVTYFMSYFLIPRFLLEKKYGKFILYIFYSISVSSYFIVLIIYGCLIFVKKWDATNIPPMIKNFFFILILVYMIAGIVGFVTILNSNFKTDKKNKELQNKILGTQLQIKEQELQYLKMQIHPHFLFNTLNTIYGFAMKQSEQTPELILKLSNLLDYILYQIDKPRVSLSEEVLHIKEYIELEKIRFQETLKVSFSSTEINPDLQIPPMLLIPFVENAFKHGGIVNGYLQIEIDVEIEDNNLIFSMANTIIEVESNGNNKGIGLENIRKRLELHYPENYKVENAIEDKWYRVKLTIFKLNDLKNE